MSYVVLIDIKSNADWLGWEILGSMTTKAGKVNAPPPARSIPTTLFELVERVDQPLLVNTCLHEAPEEYTFNL